MVHVSQLTFILLLLTSILCVTLTLPASLTDTPCCVKCDIQDGYIKYYSTVTKNKMCGESCIKEKDYWIFKLFEHNLTKAVDNTPCADENYTVYENTEVHGFGPIKVAVDFYGYNTTSLH